MPACESRGATLCRRSCGRAAVHLRDHRTPSR